MECYNSIKATLWASNRTLRYADGKYAHIFQVTWLASWTENIQNQIKYVMLNPSSRLKGEKDMEKYEKARMLKDKIEKIREDYTEGDFNGNFFSQN